METLSTAAPQAPPTGTIRQLRPSDLPRFRDHLLRLDTESRRDRFNGLTDDDFIAAYADRSFSDGTTVVGYIEDDRILGAAELHERAEDAEPTAEIAFSVERELQHRGLGGRLFERLIQQARGLGYTRLKVTTHPQNLAMKALARRFNASLHFEEGETVGIIELGELELSDAVATPGDASQSETKTPFAGGVKGDTVSEAGRKAATPVDAMLDLARTVTNLHLSALGIGKEHGSSVRR